MSVIVYMYVKLMFKKKFCSFNVYETESLPCHLRDLCIYDRVVFKKKNQCPWYICHDLII